MPPPGTPHSRQQSGLTSWSTNGAVAMSSANDIRFESGPRLTTLALNGAPTERKTGAIRAAGPSTRVRVRDGGLDLLRRAA